MIIIFIVNIINNIFGFLFQKLPTIKELPYGLDTFISSGVGFFHALADLFPPFSIIMQAFIFYLGFKLLMIIVTTFLGSRAPKHA